MKQAGILLAISSLPGRHGIGDFGSEAKCFIDHTKAIGFKVWQILPFNPLGHGNSPYQPLGSKPIDEIFINLDELVLEGLLHSVPAYYQNAQKVHYDKIRTFKNKYLRMAYKNYLKSNKRGLLSWIKKNPWAKNFAVFVTLKKKNNNNEWYKWPLNDIEWINSKDSRIIEPYLDEINYQVWLQYVAYKQWMKLKRYANKNGIAIFGDLPIYVGLDSLDVWENRESFLLDGRNLPTYVGGVPGDYFNADGQMWGNPLYDWDYLEKNNFSFWLDRLRYVGHLFDYLRIDHFRAFDSYWKIPAGEKSALKGEWAYPPGRALLTLIKNELPFLKLVAEDLGDLRPEVIKLRDAFDLPGMEVFQFSFDPFKVRDGWNEHRLLYPGTHDNMPLRGWIKTLNPIFKKEMKTFLDNNGSKNYHHLVDKILAYVVDQDARWVVLPMQDILCLNEKSRMNTPSSVGSPNWEWKLANFDAFLKRRAFTEYLLIKSNRK